MQNTNSNSKIVQTLKKSTENYVSLPKSLVDFNPVLPSAVIPGAALCITPDGKGFQYSTVIEGGGSNPDDPVKVSQITEYIAWVSEEIEIPEEFGTIEVSHGLSIEPNKCIYDLIFVCKQPDHGHLADSIVKQICIIADDYVVMSSEPILTENKISVRLGSKGLNTMLADGSENFIDHSKWKIVFRILYPVAKVIMGNKNGAAVYSTVDTMIADAENIDYNTLVETNGYYSAFDEGAALYKIVAVREYDSDIQLAPYKYATMVKPDHVNYKMFGAVLDGITDDENALQNCHAYANINKIKVINNFGTIYKKSKTQIPVFTDVDLSGSIIKATDENTDFRSWYKIGDVSNNNHSLILTNDQKAQLKEGTAYFTVLDNSIPANCVIKLEETPYCVRKDNGEFYINDRVELLIHEMNGICSGALIEDWTTAGNRNLVVDGQSIESVFKVSYTEIPSDQLTFIGCDVEIQTIANNEINIVNINRHNTTIKNFVIKPNKNSLKNNITFKNAVFYAEDCYNILFENISGFNVAEKDNGPIKSSSGHMIFVSNCMDITIKECRLQGYWGAASGENVKNIRYQNCISNKIDIQNYFRDLYIDNCALYNEGVQVGYGRGKCIISNTSYYYQNVQDYSHMNNLVTLNSSYKNIFSGQLILENINIDCYQTEQNINVIYCDFIESTNTLSVNPLKLPETSINNLYATLYENDTNKIRILVFDGISENQLVNFKLCTLSNIASNQSVIQLYSDQTSGISTIGESRISIKDIFGIDKTITKWFGFDTNTNPEIVEYGDSSSFGGFSSLDLSMLTRYNYTVDETEIVTSDLNWNAITPAGIYPKLVQGNLLNGPGIDAPMVIHGYTFQNGQKYLQTAQTIGFPYLFVKRWRINNVWEDYTIVSDNYSCDIDTATSWNDIRSNGAYYKLLNGTNPDGPGRDELYHCICLKSHLQDQNAGSTKQIAIPKNSPSPTFERVYYEISQKWGKWIAQPYSDREGNLVLSSGDKICFE